jgi:hypothetical protein
MTHHAGVAPHKGCCRQGKGPGWTDVWEKASGATGLQ